MQSSIYNTSPSPRHHTSPTTTKRTRPQQSRSRTASRGEPIPTSSDLTSNSFLRRKMANDEGTNGTNGANGANGSNGVDASNGTKSSTSELDKIQRNSLYITFNAPQVDDYHRGLFLTHPPLHTPTASDTSFNFSGTLFHAAYVDSTWTLDQRAVRDVSTSHSLVLLYRLGTLDPSLAPIAEQFSRIREILAAVPLGKEARERELGPKKGNAVLGGYDCVIWTTDAVTALNREGVLDFGGRSVDEVIAEARAIAGPPDARTMVGVDFGGLKVVN